MVGRCERRVVSGPPAARHRAPRIPGCPKAQRGMFTLGAAARGEADAGLLGHHALGGHPQHRVARLLHVAVQLLACSTGGSTGGGSRGREGGHEAQRQGQVYVSGDGPRGVPLL